jgi:hypothetical protein
MIEDGQVQVKVRTFGETIPTPEMQVSAVPQNADQRPGEPVAPVSAG